MYAFDSMEMELYEQEIKNKKMAYQNLFNTVADITGHHLLESEISEIINALQKDIDEQKPIPVIMDIFTDNTCNHEWVNIAGIECCRKCKDEKYDYPLL